MVSFSVIAWVFCPCIQDDWYSGSPMKGEFFLNAVIPIFLCNQQVQSINTSFKLMLCKTDKKLCLAAPEQREVIQKKNKEESLTLHMATEQCYFEKSKHETFF